MYMCIYIYIYIMYMYIYLHVTNNSPSHRRGMPKGVPNCTKDLFVIPGHLRSGDRRQYAMSSFIFVVF